jgi:hypothetical protein
MFIWLDWQSLTGAEVTTTLTYVMQKTSKTFSFDSFRIFEEGICLNDSWLHESDSKFRMMCLLFDNIWITIDQVVEYRKQYTEKFLKWGYLSCVDVYKRYQEELRNLLVPLFDPLVQEVICLFAFGKEKKRFEGTRRKTHTRPTCDELDLAVLQRC